ncbi:ENT domain-containing protein [Plasmodiophora brassicae]
MSTLDALRRNTLLRQYLHRFDERDWPEVVKLTMIIGVHSMKLNEYEKQTLTIDKLREYCSQGSVATAVREALPGLAQSLDDVRSQISALKGEVDPNPPAAPPAAVVTGPNPPAPATQVMRPATTRSRVAPGWRNNTSRLHHREARSQYSRQTVHGLYDDSGTVAQVLAPPATKPKAKAPAKPKPREPPRLAYSVPKDAKPADDTLVTSRFVDVPPSSRSLHAMADEMIPVKQSARAKLKKNATTSSKPRAKHAVPRHLRHVESKIKERVRQDRAVAAEHKTALHKAMSDVMMFGLDANAAKSQAGRPKPTADPGTVLGIADSFLKNPLMTPFVGRTPDHDELGLERDTPAKGSDRPVPPGPPRPEGAAPESTDELAARLRMWICPSGDVDDRTDAGRVPREPPAEVLDSLRRSQAQATSGATVAGTAEFTSVRQWSILPNDGPEEEARSVSSARHHWMTPAESDLFEGAADGIGQSPFRSSDSVEWRFAKDVFD